MTYFTSSIYIAENILTWSWTADGSFSPHTIYDIFNDSFCDILRDALRDAAADHRALVAFPAEMQEEREEEAYIDHPEGDDDERVPLDAKTRETMDREKDLLDSMPLPATPKDEAERRR